MDCERIRQARGALFDQACLRSASWRMNPTRLQFSDKVQRRRWDTVVAALGGVSAGGLGTPLLDVSQSGGGPSAFVANHPVGNAGGVTLSKFSVNV